KDFTVYAKILTEQCKQLVENMNASSMHWLFTNEQDSRLLKQQGFAMRLGCQFHWQNKNYEDFDHFLAQLSSSKRKKIRRERRYVSEQSVQLEVRHGDQMTDELWEIYHSFYRSTFVKKSGMPTLQLDFYREIGETMPRNIVIIFAKYAGNYVASAFNMRDETTLYGRHWGCNQEFHSLHFEACYYQGLDYCIAHGLSSFEPGAQGEHKISRGFLPTETWSAHWIANPEFSAAITQFVEREQTGMQHYINSLMEHSPYKGASSHD
ncbi:MAG: GNAT family N-acetyltransferase, partial [Thioalkalispiraceae bacterium]